MIVHWSRLRHVSPIVPERSSAFCLRLLVTDASDNRAFALDEMLLLNALWHERQIVTHDASTLLIQKDARSTLHRLVGAGLVEERGNKKGRTWHLSAAAYRALGDKAAYVRQRGFEPLQQEQMVLQYMEKHGKITRQDVAQLCRLTGPQAYRLLQRLVDQGLAEQVGQRGRGVHYRKTSP